MPLDSEDADQLFMKFVAVFDEVPLSEMPSVVNVLIEIASNCGKIDIVLRKVVETFNKLDEKAETMRLRSETPTKRKCSFWNGVFRTSFPFC